MYICMYVCMYVYTHIYIARERERKTESCLLFLKTVSSNCDHALS